MNFIKKYHTLLIPLLFLLGFIIPFNGYWLSGIFYFCLSWLGLWAFLSDFQLDYLINIHILLGHAIPIFSSFIFYSYLIYQLFHSRFFSWLIKLLSGINIFSYFSFLYLNVQDILIHDFSFSFFNQTLWFISSLLCMFSLFKSFKDDTIEQGDTQNAIHKIS